MRNGAACIAPCGSQLLAHFDDGVLENFRQLFVAADEAMTGSLSEASFKRALLYMNIKVLYVPHVLYLRRPVRLLFALAVYHSDERFQYSTIAEKHRLEQQR